MDLSDRLTDLGKKVTMLRDTVKTEEATKNALIMPFISALGYDVFNPAEVVPEFSAAIGEYKDARVDYAILSGERPILLIECKALGTPLDMKHCNQLQLYFHGTDAPIAVLTDGNNYKFFSDLETVNKMDTKPYMEFCLSNMEAALIPELKKLCKGHFDRDEAMSSANELKYNREFKRLLLEQMEKPHDDFVRFFISQTYDGKITQQVRERFTPIIKNAFAQFIDERINERLKIALIKPEPVEPEPVSPDPVNPVEPVDPDPKPQIVTTEEEKEAYYLIKSILIGTVDPSRVCIADRINYCNIVLDDSIKKTICRLYLNGKKWKIRFPYDEKVDEKFDIASLDDIFNYADRIKDIAKKIDQNNG